MEDKDLLTPEEAASILRITKRTVLKWARDNKVECVRLSSKVVLFTRQAIYDFRDKHTQALQASPKPRRRALRSVPIPNKKGGEKNSRKSQREPS